jgi:uncharacterized membrane protein
LIRTILRDKLVRLRTLSIFEKILIGAIFSYIVVLSLLTSFKLYCFQTMTFDFGMFVQVFWNTLHGNFMFGQPRASILSSPNFLGVHISPIILILIPFYALVESPYTLLVLQTIALGLPALYIYKIGVKVSGKEAAAVLFAIGYLVYPGTLWANWYDFHVEAFIPLFLSMAFYYYFKGNKLGLFVSMLLLLTTFESAVLVDVAFAIYIALREVLLRRKAQTNHKSFDKKLILVLLIVVSTSVVYYFVSENLMNSIWPQRELLAPKFFGVQDYNDILLKVSFIAILTAPLAFLSFNSPLEILPAIPYLVLALASDYQPYFTISWQYPAIISVPFFVAAILGLSSQNWNKTKLKIMAAMIISVVLLSPGSLLMSQFSTRWVLHLPNSEMSLRHQALSILPENSSVLAQENIFPNIAERPIIYSVWPLNSTPPDYMVVDTLDTLFYTTPPEEPTMNALFTYISAHRYGIVAMVNGFLILEKDYSNSMNVLMPLHISLEIDHLRPRFVSFEDSVSQTHFFIADWVRVDGNHLFLSKNYSGTGWWGPYITVPPGKYEVEVRYSTYDTKAEPIMNLTAYWWQHQTYAGKTVWSNETTLGQINTATIEFEMDSWSRAMEIVGISLGRANVNVYSVTMRVIT